MRKILRFVHQNRKWFFLGIMYLFICWEVYQDTKSPWYYTAIACIVGLGLGLVVVIKIIDPYLKYSDAKINSWFGIKKST